MWVAWGLAGLGAAALAVALLLGGRDEQIFGAAKAAAALGGEFVRTGAPAQAVVCDVVIALALLALVLPLALRSTKAWPLTAASVCLAVLMTAAAQQLVHARPQAYGIVQGGWTLLGDLVVAAGAWNAWRVRRRDGQT